MPEFKDELRAPWREAALRVNAFAAIVTTVVCTEGILFLAFYILSFFGLNPPDAVHFTLSAITYITLIAVHYKSSRFHMSGSDGQEED